MEVLIFLPVRLENAIHASKMFFGRFDPLSGSSLIPTPKEHLIAPKLVI